MKVHRAAAHPLDRHLSVLGLGRRDFETASGLSKQYLLRVAQGRASGLSDTIVVSLTELYVDRGLERPSDEDLRGEWETWVREHRKGQDALPSPKKGGGSPFACLVDAIGGVARTAAVLAVPDILVDRYRKAETIPQPIVDALLDVGYPYLDQLIGAQEKYFSKERV